VIIRESDHWMVGRRRKNEEISRNRDGCCCYGCYGYGLLHEEMLLQANYASCCGTGTASASASAGDCASRNKVTALAVAELAISPLRPLEQQGTDLFLTVNLQTVAPR